MNFFDTSGYPIELQETLEKVRYKNLTGRACSLYARSYEGYSTKAAFCVPIKDGTLLKALDNIDKKFIIQEIKFMGLEYLAYSFNDSPKHFSEYNDTRPHTRMVCYVYVKINGETYSIALTELERIGSYTRHKSKKDYDSLDVMLIYDAYTNPTQRAKRRLDRFIKECRDANSVSAI
jgi:hypothetical protein